MHVLDAHSSVEFSPLVLRSTYLHYVLVFGPHLLPEDRLYLNTRQTSIDRLDPTLRAWK